MIKVGDAYQAVLPNLITQDSISSSNGDAGGSYSEPAMSPHDWETLMWEPDQIIDDNLENYLRASRSIVSFAGFGGGEDDHSSALNGQTMSSMCETTQKAYDFLHQSNYNWGLAFNKLIADALPKGAPQQWTSEEMRTYSLGIRTYGKDFHRICSEYFPDRTVAELVCFYYYWKKTVGANSALNYGRGRRAARRNVVKPVAAVANATCQTSDRSECPSPVDDELDGHSVSHPRFADNQEIDETKADVISQSGNGRLSAALRSTKSVPNPAVTNCDEKLCRNCHSEIRVVKTETVGTDSVCDTPNSDEVTPTPVENDASVTLESLCTACRIYFQNCGHDRPVKEEEDPDATLPETKSDDLNDDFKDKKIVTDATMIKKELNDIKTEDGVVTTVKSEPPEDMYDNSSDSSVNDLPSPDKSKLLLPASSKNQSPALINSNSSNSQKAQISEELKRESPLITPPPEKRSRLTLDSVRPPSTPPISVQTPTPTPNHSTPDNFHPLSSDFILPPDQRGSNQIRSSTPNPLALCPPIGNFCGTPLPPSVTQSPSFQTVALDLGKNSSSMFEEDSEEFNEPVIPVSLDPAQTIKKREKVSDFGVLTRILSRVHNSCSRTDLIHHPNHELSDVRRAEILESRRKMRLEQEGKQQLPTTQPPPPAQSKPDPSPQQQQRTSNMISPAHHLSSSMSTPSLQQLQQTSRAPATHTPASTVTQHPKRPSTSAGIMSTVSSGQPTGAPPVSLGQNSVSDICNYFQPGNSLAAAAAAHLNSGQHHLGDFRNAGLFQGGQAFIPALHNLPHGYQQDFLRQLEMAGQSEYHRELMKRMAVAEDQQRRELEMRDLMVRQQAAAAQHHHQQQQQQQQQAVAALMSIMQQNGANNGTPGGSGGGAPGGSAVPPGFPGSNNMMERLLMAQQAGMSESLAFAQVSRELAALSAAAGQTGGSAPAIPPHSRVPGATPQAPQIPTSNAPQGPPGGISLQDIMQFYPQFAQEALASFHGFPGHSGQVPGAPPGPPHMSQMPPGHAGPGFDPHLLQHMMERSRMPH